MSGNSEKIAILTPICDCGMYFDDGNGKEYFLTFWYMYDNDEDLVAWYVPNESALFRRGNNDTKALLNTHINEVWLVKKQPLEESITEITRHIRTISCANCGQIFYLGDVKFLEVLHFFNERMEEFGFTIRGNDNIWQIGDDLSGFRRTR